MGSITFTDRASHSSNPVDGQLERVSGVLEEYDADAAAWKPAAEAANVIEVQVGWDGQTGAAIIDNVYRNDFSDLFIDSSGSNSETVELSTSSASFAPSDTFVQATLVFATTVGVVTADVNSNSNNKVQITNTGQSSAQESSKFFVRIQQTK